MTQTSTAIEAAPTPTSAAGAERRPRMPAEPGPLLGRSDVLPDVKRGLRYRVLTRLSGWAILRLAKIAAKHEDRHELAHLAAAISAGDTTNCRWGCKTQTDHFPLDGGVRRLVVGMGNADQMAAKAREILRAPLLGVGVALTDRDHPLTMEHAHDDVWNLLAWIDSASKDKLKAASRG